VNLLFMIANATVDRVYGLDVYVHSVPVRDYEVLKKGHPVVLGGCKNFVSNTARLSSEVGADGVIINFASGEYKAIKYK